MTHRFTPSHYPGGGYLRVHSEVGSLIDWVRISSSSSPLFSLFSPLLNLSPSHLRLLLRYRNALTRIHRSQYNVQFYNREWPTPLTKQTPES